MRSRWSVVPAALLACSVAAWPAAAYVGPGAGLGVLTALWGLLIAVAMALGFILLWPIRRYVLRRRRAGDAGLRAARPELDTAPRPSPR